jgi:hypothetical protein
LSIENINRVTDIKQRMINLLKLAARIEYLLNLSSCDIIIQLFDRNQLIIPYCLPNYFNYKEIN